LDARRCLRLCVGLAGSTVGLHDQSKAQFGSGGSAGKTPSR
jgi:hypothetical protein